MTTRRNQHRDQRYYVALITTTATSDDQWRYDGAWRWSPPLPSLPDAIDYAKERVRNGTASIAFIVFADGDRREILPKFTLPKSSRKVLDRYFDLLERAQEPR